MDGSYHETVLTAALYAWTLGGAMATELALAMARPFVQGTALGGLGILLSASMQFALTRGIGREWFTDRWGRTFEAFEARVERSGLALIGVATAHPMGPMSAFHWAAGFSSIAWIPFALVIALSG